MTALMSGRARKHFRMNEYLVMARHRAADLLAVEIDSDDIVGRHLLETDGGWLHQEAMRIVRKPHGDVPGDEVALVLAGQDATGIDELSGERLVHAIPLDYVRS